VSPSVEWDEAFQRVESYLRAHQIESRELLNQRTAEIIRIARSVADDHPDLSPVTLAMQIANARIGSWLVRVFGDGEWADERFRARGRLALFLSKLPQTAPEYFLGPELPPPEQVERLTEAKVESAPELRLTRMPPAPLEFPLSDAAEEKWTTFHRSAFFRASASWLMFAGLLGLAWLATR
jgi:hypothetical protein